MRSKKRKKKVKLQNDGKYGWISESKGCAMIIPETEAEIKQRAKKDGRLRRPNSNFYVIRGKHFNDLNSAIWLAKREYNKAQNALMYAKCDLKDPTPLKEAFLKARQKLIDLKARRHEFMVPKPEK